MLSDLRRLWRELRDEVRQAIRDGRAEFHQRQYEKDHPDMVPVSDEEADAIVAWFRSLARPALILRPDTKTAATDAPARIGGPAWLADGEQWPVDASRKRLEFVAEVDFGRLPALPGFPASGVLRFFVGRDELFGANWESPDRSGCRLLWHGGGRAGGRLEPPAELSPEDMSPFIDATARRDGVALSPTRVDDLPDSNSYPVDERLAGQGGRRGMAELEDELFVISEEREYGHRIGGHPVFTQADFRRTGLCDEFDTMLLGLSSDEAIMWGDVGEAMFMIRAAHLAACDFSRVAFYWDCY